MANEGKVPKFRIRKGYVYTFGSILLGLLVIILILSPLTKYLLEKYDVKLIGREATIGWAYVNPLTGFVHLHNVKIYERQGDSLFVTATGASANFAMLKLLSKQVEIEQLTISQPWVKIVQKKDTLSFDDVIERFTPDESKPKSPDWHVTLLGTKIIAGEFHYHEQVIPINYFIKDVTINGPGKTKDVDTLSANFSFQDGRGKGGMKGEFTINLKDLGYKFDVAVADFDLEIIRQYIWELINYGMFHARLDAQIKASGNFTSRDSISINGRLLLSDFHLGKTNEDAYIAFKKLSLGIKELSPSRDKYVFDSITLSSPHLKYEVYDSLDNVERLFGKNGKNISDITGQEGRFNLVIEIARYIRDLSRNFFKSDFQIGTLGIFDGDFTFNDYSISEKFSIRASPLTIRADSVNRRNKHVEFVLKSAIKPYGRAEFLVTINPRDSGSFDMKYDIGKIPATVFNPYLVSTTSFPLDRGTLEVSGAWTVRNSNIKSSNHVLIIDPRLTDRVRNKDTKKWIPMPLIMSLLRERGNVIDYEVPITGNMKHPKFHLNDVVTDVIRNIFVKPVTIPYRMKVKEAEVEIEKSLTMTWEMSQSQIADHQMKFVKSIAEFLKDHPAASLVVQPVEYESKEKEHILLFESKKKYFLIIHHKQSKDFTDEDSLTVSKMSAKDHAFVKYISRNVSDTVMFTVQEKCINFVGHDVVNKSFAKLIENRKAAFRNAFVANGTEKQVKFNASENNVPYNGFSYFRFNYPNGIDDKLREAYEKMNELNHEKPRKKYLKERKKN